MSVSILIYALLIIPHAKNTYISSNLMKFIKFITTVIAVAGSSYALYFENNSLMYLIAILTLIIGGLLARSNN